MGLEWLKDIKIADLLDNDTALIYEACGESVLFMLWEKLPNMPLYISERPLNDAKRRWIRKKFSEAHKKGEQLDVKRTARILDVSTRFVELALATTEKKDERQIDAFSDVRK